MVFEAGVYGFDATSNKDMIRKKHEKTGLSGAFSFHNLQVVGMNPWKSQN